MKIIRRHKERYRREAMIEGRTRLSFDLDNGILGISCDNSEADHYWQVELSMGEILSAASFALKCYHQEIKPKKERK